METKSDPPVGTSGVTRRLFLKGVSTTAGATLLGETVFGQDTTARQPTAVPVRSGVHRISRDTQEVQLLINGKAQAVKVTPASTLLDAIRSQTGNTGNKEVCDRGACGACTMLIDGKSYNSCMILAVDAVGKQVTTVEGLVKDGQLNVVQESFAACDASQCGYCIPGFVVRSRAFLDENPKPTHEEIQKGLSGNICRCAAYIRIFRAVTKASGQEVPA